MIGSNILESILLFLQIPKNLMVELKLKGKEYIVK